MAFTPEQQSELDYMAAAAAAQQSFAASNETARQAHELAMETKRARIELLRMARETLIENARSKPVAERDVSTEDITAFADTLAAYVNA
jgi:hypothetical protein